MPRFDGFQSHDFSGGIAGTTWRGRDSLGGVLAAALGNHAEAKQPFQSWGISRRPELFLAPVKHFHGEANAEAGVKRCKLFVRAEPSGLRYGLWLEKGFDTLQAAKTPADVMDDSWDWPRLAQLLQDSSPKALFLTSFIATDSIFISRLLRAKKRLFIPCSHSQMAPSSLKQMAELVQSSGVKFAICSQRRQAPHG